MDKKLFPNIKDMPGLNKEERAYLRDLLQIKLISLARELMSSSGDEEDAAQAILDKLKEQ